MRKAELLVGLKKMDFESIVRNTRDELEVVGILGRMVFLVFKMDVFFIPNIT